MATEKAPHILFCRMLEMLDDLRRNSIRALKESDKNLTLGLTVRQGSAISQIKLMQEESPEGISLKKLAQHMQMTVPATSLLVDSLVTKGYVRRDPNPNDRRAVCISLTEKGSTIYELVYARFHQEVDERARVLTEDELSAISRIIEKMQG